MEEGAKAGKKKRVKKKKTYVIKKRRRENNITGFLFSFLFSRLRLLNGKAGG